MSAQKMISLVLVLALTALAFAGCGGGSGSTEGKGSEFTVGIVQIAEHPSLDTIRTSIEAELEALGYGAVSIDYKNAQNDMNTLNTIVQTFVGDEVDAIIAIATPSAIAAAAATEGTDIPVIFSAVTDPVAANLLTDPGAPDGNVTGVSDAIPVDRIFALASQLTPEATTFGLVYNAGEPNSVSVIEDAKAYFAANGLSYQEATVTGTSEVQQAAQSLVGSVDAFFTPIDNTVAAAMPVYAQVGLDNKLPIYPGADSMVEDGGLATVGIDYTFLGQETAKIAVEVLEGKAISEIPVVTMTNFRPIANQDTADALGVSLEGVDNLEIVTND